MPPLEILEFPDPRLRLKARPIKRVSEAIVSLGKNMLETMYEANGIGLAAIQVNVQKRIIVMDVSDTHDQPRMLINPTFTIISDVPVESQEGCLSVPDFYEPVTRAERICVEHLDERGEPQTFEAEGLLAACIQHECDHLDGKLFVDYLSNLKRQRIRRKLEKKHRMRA